MQGPSSDTIEPLVKTNTGSPYGSTKSLVSNETISSSGSDDEPTSSPSSEDSLNDLDLKDIDQILSELRRNREECIDNIKLWEGALRIIT